MDSHSESGSENITRYGDSNGVTFGIYNVIAVTIFFFMSFQFLFPSNRLFPIDRRTASVTCATLVFITRRFLFRETEISIVNFIDFDVLLLLAAIMIINHVVIHLKETKAAIRFVQEQIQSHPIRGFWYVSSAAFIVSPFLTNDGCCLLMVEPILNAFSAENSQLSKVDSIFFLLTLACSSNIGSALTYTGNPQNMLVSQDAISVLSPGAFLGIQILPSLFAWLITTGFIQYCWNTSQKQSRNPSPGGSWCSLKVLFPYDRVRTDLGGTSESSRGHEQGSSKELSNSDKKSMQQSSLMNSAASSKSMNTINDAVPYDEEAVDQNPILALSICGAPITMAITSPVAQRCLETMSEKLNPPDQSELLSPRKQRLLQRQNNTPAAASYYIKNPLPYLALILLAAMIVMIFVDVMSISALICISAMIMVISMVMGNHIRGTAIWSEEGVPNEKLNAEERIEVVGEFFEELFKSIDYSLLLIFLGTFVVVANIESTHLPHKMWTMMVGNRPFQTSSSVIYISIFVLVASQLLGNVALIQMAVPQVSILPDEQKRYAWAVLSFVATVGGNLTITGSAANIIVSEKAQRLGVSVNFFKHAAVCCGVTIISCVAGTAIITGLIAAGM